MKNAGKARSYGLYRHLRTSKEIIENLLNYFFNYLVLSIYSHSITNLTSIFLFLLIFIIKHFENSVVR